MKWQKIINEIDNHPTKFQANKPLQKASKISSEFNLELPIELLEFHEETNGISEMMDDEKIGDLIWGIESVITENKEFRTNQSFKELYMSFDCLLFIGDAGNGDNFGYSIQENKIRKTDIYAWNHEDDSRIWVAPDLEMLIRWWASGKIKI